MKCIDRIAGLRSFYVPLVVSFLLTIQIAYAKKQEYIGVLPLINQSPQKVTAEETSYLTSVIRKLTGFLPSDSYIVITNDNIDVLLQEKDKNLEDCVGECALETARNLGAHWLITGKVLKFGSSLRVEVNLIHAEDGNVFTAPETIKGTDVEMLEKPLKLASLGLMLRISESFKDQLIVKAGEGREDQLQCLLDPGTCKKKQKTESKPTNEPNAFQSHLSKINQEWQTIETLSRQDKTKGLQATQDFLEKYKTHPFGNPKYQVAQETQKKLKVQIQQENQLKALHVKQVKLDWLKIKSRVSQGTQRGKLLLKSFIQKYQDHPFGNPFEAEANQLWDRSQEKMPQKSSSSSKIESYPISVNQRPLVMPKNYLQISPRADLLLTSPDFEEPTSYISRYLTSNLTLNYGITQGIATSFQWDAVSLYEGSFESPTLGEDFEPTQINASGLFAFHFDVFNPHMDHPLHVISSLWTTFNAGDAKGLLQTINMNLFLRYRLFRTRFAIHAETAFYYYLGTQFYSESLFFQSNVSLAYQVTKHFNLSLSSILLTMRLDETDTESILDTLSLQLQGLYALTSSFDVGVSYSQARDSQFAGLNIHFRWF